MTTLVASLGFLPMAFSDGMGAEVQRPLATVVIGGVIGAMIMSLLVLRVLYLIFNTPVARRPQGAHPETTPAELVLAGSETHQPLSLWRNDE
jgi:cobalt-zinc-cadmium resistance protein CzcA